MLSNYFNVFKNQIKRIPFMLTETYVYVCALLP